MTAVECRCTSDLTCGYCLRHAKPYVGFMAGAPQGRSYAASVERGEAIMEGYVPCHLPRWVNADGECEHPDHDKVVTP